MILFLIERYWTLYRELQPGALEAMHVQVKMDVLNQVPPGRGGPLHVTFVLRTANPDDPRRFVLAFQGVMDFMFASPSTAPYIELDIYPISEYVSAENRPVHPHMRYRVTEIEQDNDISFNCADFAVSVQ